MNIDTINALTRTISDLYVDDTLVIDCPKELTEEIISLLVDTGEELCYEFDIKVSDYFTKVTAKRIK